MSHSGPRTRPAAGSGRSAARPRAARAPSRACSPSARAPGAKTRMNEMRYSESGSDHSSGIGAMSVVIVRRHAEHQARRDEGEPDPAQAPGRASAASDSARRGSGILASPAPPAVPRRGAARLPRPAASATRRPRTPAPARRAARSPPTTGVPARRGAATAPPPADRRAGRARCRGCSRGRGSRDPRPPDDRSRRATAAGAARSSRPRRTEARPPPPAGRAATAPDCCRRAGSSRRERPIGSTSSGTSRTARCSAAWRRTPRRRVLSCA